MGRHGHAGHAGRMSPTYVTWRAMIQRCYTPACNGYERYGGRGIGVCDRWRESFMSFLADMGERPSRNYSIDRIDVNGHYEPGNCRWATREEQARNRRDRRTVTAFGITDSLTNILDISWVTRSAAHSRLKHGWSLERALSTPANPPLLDRRGDGNVMRRPEIRGRVAATLRRRYAAGEIRASRSSLSDEAARLIFTCRGACSADEIAERFGTTVGIVNNIWSGRTHRHLTGATRINRRVAARRAPIYPTSGEPADECHHMEGDEQ